jgi:xanthine dehydrogenase YagT iron-sulfur-binding subunit
LDPLADSSRDLLSSPRPLPAVGRAAPRLDLTTSGPPITLASFAGQPLVIAFLGDGETGTAGTDVGWRPDILRAELRGLGAALLVVSSDGLWCFQPDDQLQRFVGRDELDRDGLREARERYGAASGGVFVIDGDLDGGPEGGPVLRFAHREVATVPGATMPALIDALARATRALAAQRPTRFLLSRREMVVSCLCGALALSLDGGARALAAPPPAAGPAPEPDSVEITLQINGTARKVRVDARVTLLDALRERLGLTGTKKGCDHGQCGACTVLVDGRRVNACLTLAMMADRAPITTIEGLARGESLHPMQAAFVAQDALQCGYCTPGQIMSAIGLCREGHAHNDAEVREAMSGNICRCAAYPNILAAIQRARKESSSAVKET